ncbi:MAG TPA: FliH/SctL family protein [Symbiobacteriaceae bacterium]|nr:FliH/SctL family protein [Symbiobacteriaceae bacterium]
MPVVQQHVAPPPPVKSEEAAEAEARARAMERRAVHVLEEAEEAAARRLAEAEERAAALLHDAEAGAEAIRTGARQAGLEEGRAEGYAAGMATARTEAEQMLAGVQQEADAILAEAQSAALSIKEGALAERATLLDASEQQVLDLAFAVARQILRAELALNPTAVVPMLEAALAKLKGDEEPQIRVSPEVAQLLEEHRGRLLAAIPGARRLTVEGDPALQVGDFLVQGAQGYIDGRLEQQVAVVESEAKEEER